jgi:hypothetical protein
MPRTLELAAQLNPKAFKMAHVRFERLAGTAVPAQLIPLLLLHTGVVCGNSTAVRRAGQLAQEVNVTAQTMAATVNWAAVFGGAWTAEAAFSALEAIITSAQDCESE